MTITDERAFLVRWGVNMSRNLEKFEERAEELREIVGILCDELNNEQEGVPTQEYTILKERLKELHTKLDQLDAILADKAARTDKPDEPIHPVEF